MNMKIRFVCATYSSILWISQEAQVRSINHGRWYDNPIEESYVIADFIDTPAYMYNIQKRKPRQAGGRSNNKNRPNDNNRVDNDNSNFEASGTDVSEELLLNSEEYPVTDKDTNVIVPMRIENDRASPGRGNNNRNDNNTTKEKYEIDGESFYADYDTHTWESSSPTSVVLDPK